MLKRDFLKTLAGLFAGAPLAAVAVAAEQRILLQTSSLAGFYYYDGEKVWPQLRSGQGLVLQREPQNPYDTRAVALFWQGHKLGYIPRRDNAAIAQLLDRGELLTARIETLQHSDDPWQRIGISVTLQR